MDDVEFCGISDDIAMIYGSLASHDEVDSVVYEWEMFLNIRVTESEKKELYRVFE